MANFWVFWRYFGTLVIGKSVCYNVLTIGSFLTVYTFSMTMEDSAQTTQFGKIIATDGGLTPSHLAHHQVALIFCFVATIAFPLFIFVLSNSVIVMGIMALLWGLLCFQGVHQLSVEKKTNITVCENGIIGESLQSVLLSLYWLESVRLPYETITAVDSHEGSALGEHFFGKTITIHSSGRQYRFMVKKPAEIQQAIFEQRYRLQQQRQSQ